jgi:hypothetical protein
VLINTEWFFSDSLILNLLDVSDRMLVTDFPLVQQCLTIISNLTYFTTSLARSTASQLVDFFAKIAYPNMLYSNVHYFMLVNLLLESFNNIIQFHIGGVLCLKKKRKGKKKKGKKKKEFEMSM